MIYVTSYLHITTWEISKACNQCEKWFTIMTSTFQMWRRLGRPVSVPFQSGLSSSFPSRHQDDKRGATALGSPTQSSPTQQPSRAEKEPTNQNQPLDHRAATFQISKSDRGRINEPRLRAGSSYCPFTLSHCWLCHNLIDFVTCKLKYSNIDWSFYGCPE